MSKETSTKNPVTLIIHGANTIGEKLTELLSTQKSQIVLVDTFTKAKDQLLRNMKEKYNIFSYDISGLESISKKYKRIDYIFLLNNDEFEQKEALSSKEFLSETNIADVAFKLGVRHSSKILLASTIELHRLITEQKDTWADKLSEVSAKNAYTPAELQRYCENLAAEYHDQSGLNVRIARLGEIIGKKISTEKETIFVQMVKEAITKPRITIKGEGLDYSYYVHLLDAVYGLIKAMFSSKTNGEVFTISYPEEISVLNLAYRILELNPKATEIVFTEAEEETMQKGVYIPAQNLTKLGWKPKIPFEKALHETIEYFYEQYKIKWDDKPTAERKPIKDKPKVLPHRSEKLTATGKALLAVSGPLKGFFGAISETFSEFFSKFKHISLKPKNLIKYGIYGTIFLILYIFIINPIFQIVGGSTLTYYYGQKGYNEAKSLETEKAARSLEKANYFASVSTSGWEGLFWLKYIKGVDEEYNDMLLISSSIEHLTKSGQYLVQGLDPYATYFKEFEPVASFDGSAGQGSREYLNELKDMESNLHYIDSASFEISLAKESLTNVNPDDYPEEISKYIKMLKDQTGETSDIIGTFSSFAAYIPEILGKDGRQTYVILLKNPMELRSTGGWISCFAIVGIEHGQVRELEVKDVYEADGKLDEKIAPPEMMQDALDINQWNLSLSNWSADYPESAETAEYFLKLEDQIVSADGIISIDLEYARQLIDIWGELKVDSEDEKVTKDNLYDKIIEIHRNFTPGSTEKPVFLSNLANALLVKTLKSPSSKWPAIAQTTVTALNEKHVQIYMFNSEIDKLLSEQGWNGQLEHDTNQVYLVEWNNGGNKANYFIDRTIDYKMIIIDENEVQQKVTVNYTNRSTENRYPEGEYENFVRLYIPIDADITKTDGVSSLKIYNDEARNFKIVTGWVNVPINSAKQFSVSYALTSDSQDFPLTVEPGGKIKYTLNLKKQSGTMNDEITVQVAYPEQWNPFDYPNMHREINSLVEDSELKTDKKVEIIWEL
ncbi:DUF4012 domain-containing protein [Candidatus Dojkabacteria bacterium]|nr:DUF4012 domain-containing protein [Candidatus Dojkabacteria bacterium]